MPIYFGDTIQNQNGDYPVLDLLGNHAAGVAFIDAWSDEQLQTISVPRRKTGMIVAVKASDDAGELYMWTGLDEQLDVAAGAGTYPGAFNNPDNELWKQIGGGVDSLRTVDIPVQLGTDANGHPQTFGRFSDGDTIEMLPSGSNAFDIIIDAVTGFVDPVVNAVAVTEETEEVDGQTVGLGTYTTTGVVTTIPYDDQQRTGIETDMRFNIKNSSQGAISGDTLKFKIWKIVIESSTSSTFQSNVTTEQTLLSTDAVPDPIFASVNAVLSGTAPAFHELHYEDTFTVAANATGAQVYYRCKLFQANGQGQIELANGTFADAVADAGTAVPTVTGSAFTRLTVGAYTAPRVVDIQARRSGVFSDIAPDYAITSLAASGIASWNYTWIGGASLTALATFHSDNSTDNIAQTALSRQTLVGNNGFDFQCTIKRQTSAVDILRVEVQRKVDGGAWTTVQDTDFNATENTAAETAGYDLDTAGTLASNFSLRLVDTNATVPTDSIEYRVRIKDESHGADDYEDIEVLSIDMWNPVYVGQSLIDNDVDPSAPAGVQLATLAANQTALDDTSVEALVGAGNKLRFAAARPGFGSNIARASNSQGMASISTSASEFVYIVYPDSDPMLQWIGEQEGVGQNQISAFCTSAAAANPAQSTGPGDLESFADNTLAYENAAGYSQTYRVFRTLAKDAFNTAVSLNIF